MGEVGVPPALADAVDSLREAVTAGRTDIVRRILDACDSCDGGGTEERKQLINSHCARDGGTFLHLATKLGHGDIVRALLSGGGDPGVVDSAGNTPPQAANTAAVTAVYTEDLLRATAQSDLGRVCQLLAGGLSVNSYDNAVSRNTPLHWAASFADTDTIHCLIARGAGVHSINSYGATALHDAVARADAASVLALLQHGAKPAAQRCIAGRHKGKTPMEMAQEKGGEVLTVMERFSLQATKGATYPGVQSTRKHSANETRDNIDLRALAGSLESLNSIGGDSVLLANGSIANYHQSTTATNSIYNDRKMSAPPAYGRSYLGRVPAQFDNITEGIHVTTPGTLSNGVAAGVLTNGAAADAAIILNSNSVVAATENKGKSAEGAAGQGLNSDSRTLEHREIKSVSRSPLPSTSSLDLCPNMEQVYERLVSNSSSGPPARLVTSARLHQLWPQPRHITQLTGEPWRVPRLLTVAIMPGQHSAHSMCDILEAHRTSLEECGVKISMVGSVSSLSSAAAATDGGSGEAGVVCSISTALSFSPQQYTLTVTHAGVRIMCGSLASMQSAFATLTQLLRVNHSGSDGNATASDTTRLAPEPSNSSLLRQTSEPQHMYATSIAGPHVVPLVRSQSEDSSTSSASTTAKGDKSEDKESHDYTDIEVESVVIVDSPDVPHRAFMMDAAPLARIPILSTMYDIVDTLASLKLNQLHLMMRLQPISNSNLGNTNQYYSSNNANSGLTSAYNINLSSGDVTNSEYRRKTTKASPSCCHCPLPYTSTEILKLSRYCNDRGISLVPAYDLDHSWGNGRTTACSTSEITAAVTDNITQFPDVSFVSIGPGLTLVLASTAASQPTVNPWQSLGITDKTTLIVCGNALRGNNTPSLRQYVPYTALLMEYGFQADYDFSCGRDAAHKEGRPVAVCPGTAAWSSLAGFPEAGVSNVYKGCVDKGTHIACCMVVAHWTTPASLTPLVFMWPALVVAAGLAWNSRTHWDYVHSSIASLIDTHLVRINDCGFGSALIELGRCETWLTREMRRQDNSDLSDLPPTSTGPGSTLHQLLADPDGVILDNLNVEKFGSVLRHIKRSVRGIDNNRVVNSLWPLMPVAASELNLSADLMMTSCRIGRALVTVGSNPYSNLGMAVVNPGLAHLPPTVRTDIANRLLSIRESYSCLWLHCHQAPGLQASLLLLSSLLARLLPQHNIIHNL